MGLEGCLRPKFGGVGVGVNFGRANIVLFKPTWYIECTCTLYLAIIRRRQSNHHRTK